MATKRARGAIRASRRRPLKRQALKRLIVTPPKTRRAMLGASALVGGALGNLAAFVARPRPIAKWARRGAALAAGMVGSALLLPVAAWALPDGCNPSNSYTWTCKGTVSTPGGPYAPSGSDYSFTFKGSNSGHAYVLTSSTTFTINSPGLSGELDFNPGSSITNNVGNGLVINSTVGNQVSSDTIIMDGQLRAGATYDGDTSSYIFSDHNADGLRIVGGSINEVTIKVGKNDPTAVIEGSDDGIFINPDNITGEDAKVTITNFGTVAGMGMSGDASNASEGIHISGGGSTDNPNGYAGDGYQVDAAVEIDNYGTISGQLEHSAESFDTANAGGLGGGGQGISVSANNKINIDNYADATITGTEGIFAYGGGNHNIILTNDGHIEGLNGDGADLANANVITVENHSLGSMIGATNGQEISYANTTSYDNSGGLTAGLGGDGLLIHNINGATSNIPEYAVTVINTAEVDGTAGGIIVGSVSGVSMYGIDTGVSYVPGQNGVLVDNSGSGWGDDAVAGGLIVGETGNGVEITGTTGDVTIDNSGTRNGAGNDLSSTAIDPLVGYDGYTTDTDPVGTTLLDQLVHGSTEPYAYDLNYVYNSDYAPSPVDGGITTGIWGGGNGVYMQNIAGTVSVDNSHGQILGNTSDGIRLWDVGTGVTGDVSQTVVDIDNHGGLVEGVVDGANLQGVQNGSLLYDNQYGITLGGTNGIYIGTNDVTDLLSVAGNVTIQNEDGFVGGALGDGVSIDKVGGDVSIYNGRGWGWWSDGGTIGGGVDGVAASNIGGSFSLDNQRGLTFGFTGDGVDVSNVAGAGEGAGNNAVEVDNGHGGLIVGGEGDGISISSVTGDSEDGVGDSNNVYIDNAATYSHHHLSAGGLIVGLDGDGISVTGVKSDNEGETVVSGSLTINNQSTASTSIDLADAGALIYDKYDWCDPASGLLGQAGFGHGEDGEQTTGIFGSSDGIYADNIGGDVNLYNEDGLVVGGNGAGVSLSEIGGNVDIENGKAWRHGDGGQIYGDDYGVYVNGVGGNFTVGNDDGTIYSDAESSYGIYGTDISGKATITNAGGSIATGNDVSGTTGIYLSGVGTDVGSGYGVEIDNGSYWVRPGDTENYGVIIGATGIHLNDISNGVDFNNSRGITYGHEQAFVVDGETSGTILVNNSAGIIEGYLQDGISISGDNNNAVIIENGNDHGGDILGGSDGSAITAANVNSVQITNGYSWWDCDTETVQGGLIAGAGTPDHAVIDVETGTGQTGGASITNNGIIGGLGLNAYAYSNDDNANYDADHPEVDAYNPDLPGITYPLSLEQTPGDLAQIYDDAGNIWNAVATNLNCGSLENLGDYAAAAADLVVNSGSGSVTITNNEDGILFGTVDLQGYNSWTVDEETQYAANGITNYGEWFTQGDNYLQGSPDNTNAIHNEGLIQTAFGNETPTTTVFHVDDFYNDEPAYDAYLSSMDGVAGNVTEITGNFHGSSDESEAHSYVALDAYLDVPGDTAKADLLQIDGAAYGTTALIINNLNTGDLAGANTDGIEVVQVNSPDGDGCAAAACADNGTDSFYISDRSSNYLDINGHGTIQQGLFAWYLTEQATGPENSEDGYYLVTSELPTADQAPALTTAFINLFYAGTDIVSDHLYGGHFPEIGSGGGGGDVTPQGPDQSKTNAAVWARASGSWTNQTSTVDTGLGTYDTGFNQSTYTLLGGVDMSPNGGATGLRFGAYGGYVQSDLSFTSYGATGKYTGGEVGAYAAYTQGGFYVDAQVDGDFLNVHFDAPLGAGTTIDTSGNIIGVVANIGNRVYSGKNFFEPLASFAYANTTLDDQTVGGDNVHFSNGESLRGGVGARIGTTQKVKSGVVEYTLLGRLWNEFAGDNTITVSDGVNPAQSFTDNTRGLMGEVNGTVTFADTKTNVSTFLSGGAMFGSDFTTWDAKAGVRKEF